MPKVSEITLDSQLDLVQGDPLINILTSTPIPLNVPYFLVSLLSFLIKLISISDTTILFWYHQPFHRIGMTVIFYVVVFLTRTYDKYITSTGNIPLTISLSSL